jgi:hypothetical protein
MHVLVVRTWLEKSQREHSTAGDQWRVAAGQRPVDGERIGGTGV